ncbi:MAG TPA: hypothetical protein VEY30_08925, partial [Myxococcaceae bacterium]|nr:hypothetical protein [Myxococcaceae bacterium]
MIRHWGWCAALTATIGQAAFGAELTRIASSGEPNDPFDMVVNLEYVRTQQRELITREAHIDGGVDDVGELRFVGVDNRLNVDVRIGIWQDLEFRYQLPIVFSQNRRWAYARGRGPGNSSITDNCLNADGTLTDPACPTTGVGSEPIAPVPSRSYRGGLGNMTFGLAYAFFNQAKDDTKPTWIAGFDYEAPTAPAINPYELTSSGNRGSVGDKVHKYRLYTSLSRRMGIADPYFQVHYTLPVRAGGFYSNCDNPDPDVLGSPANCGAPGWSRKNTGIDPPHQAGVVFGTELNAQEDAKRDRKLAFDVRVFANYVSKGRYYNELSDLLRRLLYTQDYLNVGASLGVVAHASEFLHFNARFGLAHNTEHTL